MSTQWAYLVCPECDTGFDTQSDLDGHTCPCLDGRGGSFRAEGVVVDTEPSWVGKPIRDPVVPANSTRTGG